MRLTIDIEDVTNLDACADALERLYDAIQEHHGHRAAHRLFFAGAAGYLKYSAEDERRRILNSISFAPEDFRLALEFHAMPRPNKEGLAKDLARKNETPPQFNRYGPRGTTSPTTMLKQITRVLKREEIRDVAKLGPAERAEALRVAETFSGINAMMRADGKSVRRRRPLRMRGRKVRSASPPIEEIDLRSVGTVVVTRG
jgi:hypothetical protein